MKVRILSAIVGIALLVPVLWFSGTVVLPIAAALLALLAAYEMCACIGLGRKWAFLLPSVAVAFVGVFMTHFIHSSVVKYIAFLAMLVFAYFFLCMMIAVVLGGKESFSSVAQAVIGVVYITVGFASVALLRRIPNGEYLFGLIFVGAWVTDTMAYFTGYFLGKHRLCPKISPKKTVEGSIGGIVFCAGAFALYGFIVQRISGLSPNYVMLLLAGAATSAVSQFGDLIASFIKREHDVKDYGKIMPGHGGVMDRFDSILAVAPFLLLVCGFASAFAFFS